MKEKFKKTFKEIYPYIIVIIVVVLIRTFLATPALVDGASMEPTLKDNNLVLVDKLNYRLNDIKRFDIIILNYKTSDSNYEKLIKRVIGLPGDKVEYRDGNLYINGFLTSEDFSHKETADFKLESIGYINIPGDKYFVVGDNRPNSNDSRISVGLVDKKDIIGNVSYSLFPFKKLVLK